MKNNENEIILLGCIIKKTQEEKDRLEELLRLKLDWAYIGGQLLHHRLSGYFYHGLEGLRKYLFSEFSSTLKLIFDAQTILTKERYEVIKPIIKDFDDNNLRWAGLKGLVYCLEIYPYGVRRSNDCDFLVYEGDLDKVDDILRNQGYIQSLDNGKTEATRQEKLIQRMNYHDLAGYFKPIKSNLQDSIKIDINFHIDSKDNDITLKVFDYGTVMINKDGYFMRMLIRETHFIQLCIHFYRETTNTLWTKRRKDILLYKIVDCYNTFRDLSNTEVINIIDISKQLNVDKQVCFTFYYLNEFYDDKKLKIFLNKFNYVDTDFLKEIYDTKNNTVHMREKSYYDTVFDLVFCNNREAL